MIDCTHLHDACEPNCQTSWHSNHVPDNKPPEIFHQLAMLQYESDALLMMTSLLFVKNSKIAISYQGVNVVALEAYIVPALMPCSNDAWRFLLLPDRARHKYKKARNYAGLAAFYAFRCLAVPDAGSLPLDRGWRFAGNIVNHPVDATDFVDDAVGDSGKQGVG